MLFNSLEFLIFFPVVCLGYYLIPHRVRYIFLLVCSYYFYMCWNPQYALLLLTSTAITYLSGLFLEWADGAGAESKRSFRKKLCVAGSFTGNLAILFFFKYYAFAANTLIRAFGLLGIAVEIPALDIILPVGISFYTFQALSYTMDVYRGEIRAERNFLKYALFVSFFPQLVAGPIERSKNLLSQIDERHRFEFERVRSGLLLMLYGYFQKVVLSEYLAVVVNQTYDAYLEKSGSQLLFATVCFAFQIYCDFGGYSNIAIGAARVMGFRLMENFNAPYFAASVSEFWRRWHISLSTWFRDYLYIPLGGNRRGKLRRQINLMTVFLVSGLWHGASWHFVLWGCMNGAYQVVGEWLAPLRRRIRRMLRIRDTAAAYKVFCMGVTFALIDISWIFFRASFRQGIEILKRIFGISGRPWLPPEWTADAFGLGLPFMILMLVSVGILIAADIFRYRGISLIDWICSRPVWIRWPILYAAIFYVLIFGVYGPGYNASEFIYFQF